MLKVLTFLVYTFPRILAWLYLLVAVLSVVVHIKSMLRKVKIPVGQWLISAFNIGYVMLFIITRVFFFQVWEHIFSALGIIAIIVSFTWSRYADRRSGRRWWNW